MAEFSSDGARPTEVLGLSNGTTTPPHQSLMISASFKDGRSSSRRRGSVKPSLDADNEFIMLLHGADPVKVELNRLENEVRGLDSIVVPNVGEIVGVVRARGGVIPALIIGGTLMKGGDDGRVELTGMRFVDVVDPAVEAPITSRTFVEATRGIQRPWQYKKVGVEMNSRGSPHVGKLKREML